MSDVTPAINLYGIKNCDTMKKARNWLDENQIEYVFHDYKKSGIERKLLSTWVSQHGWETVLNRRGTTYRKLPDEIKENMNQGRAIDAMLEQPSMIKRPVLAVTRSGSQDIQILVGFDKEQYSSFLL